MKRFVLTPLVLAAAVFAGSASAQDVYGAQSYGYDDRDRYTYDESVAYQDGYGDRYADARYDDRYDDRYADDRYGAGYGAPTPDRYGREGRYDMARVLRVDPIVARGAPVRQECYGQPAYDDRYAYGRGYSDPYARGYSRPRTSGTGAVVGAIIGGVIGHAVADDDRGHRGYYYRGGNNQAAATVLGAVVGGAIGNGVEQANARRQTAYYGGQGGYYGAQSGYGGQYASNCVVADGYDGRGRVEGYRVTYEYAGRRYETVTDYHPGQQLRVRVDVTPQNY